MQAVTDHSQSGEQSLILEWADRHGPGRWLDLGAYDGETASNTRALALAGWSGVAVEPSARPFHRLAALYADRPDVECVQAAIVTGDFSFTDPLVRFYMTDDMVSTGDESNRETWGELADFIPVYVATVTVGTLLRSFPGPYDMISVDVEGGSLEIARALLDNDALAPGGLLCVECEDGGERWEAQQWCLDGFARVGVTPNNLLLEML